jgi:hypothetical protein
MPAKQPPRVDDPGYWRFRAANTRELAKESTDEMSKTLLGKIAETFDALAQNAEERRRRKQEDHPSGGRKKTSKVALM